MSILSPTFHPEQGAGRRVADLLRRLAARAAAAAAAHAARAKGRRDNRRLLELDEHILRDIGVTRDSLYR